jgi:hypothetical protein
MGSCPNAFAPERTGGTAMAVARRLNVDHTLCLYSNPFKQSLYLLGSLGFVAVGFLLLSEPKFRANTSNVVMAYLCIGFFGLGVVVFLYSMARDLLLRRPLLQVDTRGWTYSPALGQRSQHIPWQDVARVALYRQRVRSSRMFYLVLEAHQPDEVQPSGAQALTARLYPSMSLALITVPLNTVFMRTAPTKVERLLHRVQAAFSSEFNRYDIAVASTIQDM